MSGDQRGNARRLRLHPGTRSRLPSVDSHEVRWRRSLQGVASVVEVAQVRRFGRSALATAYGVDVLVLHTKGRRSGVERDTVLSYVELDGSLHHRHQGSVQQAQFE